MRVKHPSQVRIIKTHFSVETTALIKNFGQHHHKIVIKIHTKARETHTSSTVQRLVLEQGQGADLGSGPFVPSLISRTSACGGGGLRARTQTGLLLNSVISVAPVWRPVRATGRLPPEGD